MNKVMKEIIKYDTDSGTMIASSSGDTAIIFTVDNEFAACIGNTTKKQLDDIALFMDYDPDRQPSRYLSNKYNFDFGEDIFGGVMRWQEWFDVLYDLGVIDDNQLVEFNNETSLDEALFMLLY